jgi:hypothetical protein
LQHIDSEEMAWWHAYDQFEPIGPASDRYLAAMLLSVLFTVHSSKTWKPEDFMPGRDYHEPPDPEADTMKLRAIFGGIAAAQQGKTEADA